MTTTASESGHVQIVKVAIPESVEKAALKFLMAYLITVVVLVAVIGACGVIMGLNLGKQTSMDRDFRDAQQQSKLVERRLIDMESYAMLNGWKIPTDDTHGPTGNLERMKPKENADGRR